MMGKIGPLMAAGKCVLGEDTSAIYYQGPVSKALTTTLLWCH